MIVERRTIGWRINLAELLYRYRRTLALGRNQIQRISNSTFTGGFGGTNNGCFDSGGTLTNPKIKDLGSGLGGDKQKYFLIGLKSGVRVGGISLSN